MTYEFIYRDPYKHQYAVINFMLQNKKGYNFSGMGSGKTAASLWATDILMEEGKIKKTLILCPLSIMHSVWVEEIKETVPNRGYSIVHGTRPERLRALAKDASYYISNHDAVRTYGAEFLKANFDVIIIDEVDAYKNHKSKRSIQAQKICDKAKATYGLTGTPLANSPEDAFGIGKCVNPSGLPVKYITRWRQMTLVQIAPFIFEPRLDCAKVIHAALQPAIAFKLEDCVDLPDISYRTMEFDMEPKQKKYYDKVRKDQLAEFGEGTIVAQTAAIKANKLLQISAGAVYDEDGNVIIMGIKDKIDSIENIARQVGQVIVFSQFVKVADHLGEQVKDSRVIYGKTPRKQRDQILADFKASRFSVLIAQPRILSHGVNMQFCSTIIFFGPILGNAYYRQAIGRIRRSGQKKKQLIINFSCTKVEKKLYKALETKEITSQEVLELYYNE
ncbi:MAG: hypothetical protein DRP85_03190 [Candidatus Makaraimicrobium thalassicum]|nr:MAG: hypothetical protein DRP85_03190 [Candidatus Omnitrophota bacterium]